MGLGVGIVNGLLSFRIQGQALILTLGVGFVVTGAVSSLNNYWFRFWRKRFWCGAKVVV